MPVDSDAAFDGLLREAAHVTLEPPEHASAPLLVGGTLADGRFQVLRQIGRGGMGIVYEAFDAERRERVALKLLARQSAESIYRLKNEFRTLVDLHHENLIVLHELFADGTRWFYTMQLVSGLPFDRYVRPDGAVSFARLRACLPQLGRAVAAIHAAGKLHRDLKPSNVLVDERGKLLVLDFGLTVDAQAGGIGRTRSEPVLCGTPEYMAPEQIAGRAPETASDLYAVGVMLYEALTGRLPFEGTFGELIAAKQRDAVVSPRAHDAQIPAELDRLCCALLARDPRQRPGLEVLLADRPPGLVQRAAQPPASMPPLLGRASELSLLRAAYDDAAAGLGVVVHLVGESGIGKSALCAHFLADLRAHEDFTLLAGRCHERESVPFKALDPLMDALGRDLRRIEDTEAAALVPPDCAALTRLFPTLSRVPAFAAVEPLSVSEREELSYRGVRALSALFASLRAARPLLLYLDDVQWADVDSLLVLRKLLTDERGFPALLIASRRPAPTRAGRRGSRPGVRFDDVLEAARDHERLAIRQLALGPLSHAAAVALVAAHWPHATRPEPRTLEAAARESRGNPLFAMELARFAEQTPARARSLDDALAARCAALPESARRLLELLALTAEPLLARVALAAVDASHDEIERLRAARLVRVDRVHGTHGSGRTLECYHDRVRECVAARLDDATRRAHALGLSAVLARLDDASAELFRRCLIDAGEYDRAATLAGDAADAAFEALAFDRAAELYAQAAAFTAPHDVTQRLRLLEARAMALGNTARGAEAAEAFRAAAQLADGQRRHTLLCKASETLLFRGDFSEGMSLLEPLCAEAGVAFPRSAAHARALRAVARTRLWARGLTLAKKQDPSRATRLATLSTLASGFVNYLPLHASAATLNLLLSALEAGNGQLAFEALGRCALLESRLDRSPAGDARVAAYFAKMEEITPTSPLAQSYLLFSKGVVAFQRAAYLAASVHLKEALRLVRPALGVTAMVEVALIFLQRCARELGQYAELARETPPLLERTVLQGRVFSSALLCGRAGMLAWLMRDDPDAGLRRLDEVRRLWRTPAKPLVPDLELLAGELSVLSYCGRHEAALALAQQHAPQFEGAHWAVFHGVPWMTWLLGQTAALSLPREQGSHQLRLRAIVVRGLEALRRGGTALQAERVPLELALALADDDRDAAVRCLRQGLSWCGEAANARGAILRVRLGELLGGDEGTALIRQGRTELTTQGAKNIEALVNFHLASTR